MSSAFWLLDLAYALVLLGRVGEEEEVLDAVPATPWSETARLFVAGDPASAAEVLDGMDAAPEAAYVRLKSGIEPEVRRALDFYRSVGATRYLDEGERMLSKSA